MSTIDPTLFFEPAPTGSEKLLYDQFIAEYIKDFNALEAAIRVGFSPSFAMEYAKVFVTKPTSLARL